MSSCWGKCHEGGEIYTIKKKIVWLIHKLWTEPGCWKLLIEVGEERDGKIVRGPGIKETEGWLCMVRQCFSVFVCLPTVLSVCPWDMNPQQDTAQLSVSLIWDLDRNSTQTLTKHTCPSMLLNTYLYTVHADRSNIPSPSHTSQHSDSSTILSGD